jgi:hypothetical protein
MVPEARGLSIAAFSEMFQQIRRSISEVLLPAEPERGATEQLSVSDQKQHHPDEDQQEVVLAPVVPVKELVAAAGAPRLSTSSQVVRVSLEEQNSNLPTMLQVWTRGSTRRPSVDMGTVGDYPQGFDITALIMAQREDGVWSPVPLEPKGSERKRGWRDSAGISNRIQPVNSSR